jgi:hypothetical protein
MAEGFVLGTVYLDRLNTAPAAFDALLDEIRRDDDVWAVVVPTTHHLADGDLQAMKSRLQHGAIHVLVAAPNC